MESEMIIVENLVKAIRKPDLRGARIEILRGISLHIERGSISSIIGLNGAGKSTLIKVIMGFASATSGRVMVDPDARIGYLPENPYYYDYLTLRELLWFSARSFNLEPDILKRRTEEISLKVGMADHLDKRLRGFSKGMTQRAGIAAALIHDPSLIVFDEPMSGLDPLGRKMVFDLLKELQVEGKTVLFCSHILEDVERLCDRVVVLHQGRVMRELGRSDLLLAQKGIEIVLRNQPDVIQVLDDLNLHYTSMDTLISCFTKAISPDVTLKSLTARGIEIVTVRSSVATLERIFSEIVVSE